MLTPFAPGIWTCAQDLNVMGLELGTRMTVVDLDGRGRLFIHSPIRLHPQLQSEIQKLGIVSCVVAPNKMHHLFAPDFAKAFSVPLYGAPGLESKRRDVTFTGGLISSSQDFPWNPELEHVLIEGTPLVNEVVFYHPLSRTLILTDLALHVCESDSWRTRLSLRLIGAYQKFGWSKFEKFLFIRDARAFHKSLEQVYQWDFERVVLAHGTPLSENGKTRLQDAFAN